MTLFELTIQALGMHGELGYHRLDERFEVLVLHSHRLHVISGLEDDLLIFL